MTSRQTDIDRVSCLSWSLGLSLPWPRPQGIVGRIPEPSTIKQCVGSDPRIARIPVLKNKASPFHCQHPKYQQIGAVVSDPTAVAWSLDDKTYRANPWTVLTRRMTVKGRISFRLSAFGWSGLRSDSPPTRKRSPSPTVADAVLVLLRLRSVIFRSLSVSSRRGASVCNLYRTR